MRGVWQIFAGNLYVTGASGDSPDIAAQELVDQYEVAAGLEVNVHSGKNSHVIKTPERDERTGEDFSWKLTRQ